ncbi:hypothetical protein OGH69_07495 [Flavobacterium sp. MFBS3-15]|uniref:hypothetical protein n=1 Tax=Flavobacterium sp. MFBS3-15 TaxID=2989816 RepID=UPI00223581B3|nr:hypothetical protein [Flavobacterium sp. MFBS3-15]MCW4468800.1 hypothetical protein [Flavobacterium sp. MFBS3-15]
MKKFLFFLTIVAFASCSAGYHTIDGAALHADEITAISQKLFAQGNDDWELPFKAIDELELTREEKKLLGRKLRYTEAMLVYDDMFKNGNDSLVVFFHDPSIAHQHAILVDMKKIPRKRMPDGCERVTGRVYYSKSAGGLRTAKIFN